MMQTARTYIQYLSHKDFSESLEIFRGESALRFIQPLQQLEDADFMKRFNNQLKEIKDGVGHHWACRMKTDNSLAGLLNLKPMPGSDRMFIGYIIRRDLWGKGFGLELATWIVEHARAELGIESLYALIEKGNMASIRIVENLGFRFESLKKEKVGNDLLTYKLGSSDLM